jgi:hypothetical protein
MVFLAPSALRIPSELRYLNPNNKHDKKTIPASSRATLTILAKTASRSEWVRLEGCPGISPSSPALVYS